MRLFQDIVPVTDASEADLIGLAAAVADMVGSLEDVARRRMIAEALRGVGSPTWDELWQSLMHSSYGLSKPRP